jgi:large subunit ribosomal protein L4
MATATAKTEKTTLPKSVFGVEVTSHELLKLAYDSYLAAQRQASATTKTRGLVRGGGKKPWRQKGTGRARFGSSRNPIWRGGGIVFGPLGNENYTKRLSTSSKRLALRQALSLANKAKKIIVLTPTTTGKTKDIVGFLSKHDIAVKRALLVTDAKTPELMRATKNIPHVELVSARYLTVYHILNADRIIISPSAVTIVEAWLKKEPK